MRKENKFRFSLQFSAGTEEKLRIGELLEESGNRKSALILEALSEYVQRHSEDRENGVEKEMENPAKMPADIERLIERTVEEKIQAWLSKSGAKGCQDQEKETEVPEDWRADGGTGNLAADVSEMLENLKLFQ